MNYDQEILSTISGVKIEFDALPPCSAMNFDFDTHDVAILDSGIGSLLQKGVIVQPFNESVEFTILFLLLRNTKYFLNFNGKEIFINLFVFQMAYCNAHKSLLKLPKCKLFL